MTEQLVQGATIADVPYVFASLQALNQGEAQVSEVCVVLCTTPTGFSLPRLAAA